ncbi:glycosyltransferase [Microbispora sp. H10670]|uniref:glycosyltransferase n=1 Tax=Microbispora sp. H10670 TaxID=2729108 RepID=UPI001C72488E|nr:hypothetical protein [Microbispora sp. H10670]
MNVLLCPLSDGGYLYPAIAAGRELQRRGNTVCVLGRTSAAQIVAESGLPYLTAERYGGQRGFSVARWRDGGPAQFRAALRAARQVRADVLVTSVLCHGALLAAEALDIPAVVLGLSAHLLNYAAGGHDEPQPGMSRQARSREILQYYRELRAEVGLAARSDPWPESPLFGAALLLRGDPVFEYPGAVLPERVHHVGPLAWEPTADGADVDTVMEHLDRVGKPVVYVHLGRFFGGKVQWPRLNSAFTGGPFQALVEQGRTLDPRPDPGADMLLVRRPYMGPFVDRAGLVLTSGTSAPVLAALLRGRPLGVTPNGSEQPLLAAACVRAGVAVYALDDMDSDPWKMLRLAWEDPGLRKRAADLGRRLASADSASRAADVVELSCARVARKPHRPADRAVDTMPLETRWLSKGADG